VTPLQDALSTWGDFIAAFRAVLDEREWAALVAVITIFSASENTRMLADEWRDAETEEGWLP